ncbi:MAG: hypothetical protein RQ731_08075 [Anaerosomatales bacterium]|nr:hypothetical protein [Anaerosomatales bacterium]
MRHLTDLGYERLAEILGPPFQIRLGDGFSGTGWLPTELHRNQLVCSPPEGEYAFAQVRNSDGETVWSGPLSFAVNVVRDSQLVFNLFD